MKKFFTPLVFLVYDIGGVTVEIFSISYFKKIINDAFLVPQSLRGLFIVFIINKQNNEKTSHGIALVQMSLGFHRYEPNFTTPIAGDRANNSFSRCFFLEYRHQFFSEKRGLQPTGLPPSRGIAPSGFRPLRKIPHCCLP